MTDARMKIIAASLCTLNQILHLIPESNRKRDFGNSISGAMDNIGRMLSSDNNNKRRKTQTRAAVGNEEDDDESEGDIMDLDDDEDDDDYDDDGDEQSLGEASCQEADDKDKEAGEDRNDGDAADIGEKKANPSNSDDAPVATTNNNKGNKPAGLDDLDDDDDDLDDASSESSASHASVSPKKSAPVLVSAPVQKPHPAASASAAAAGPATKKNKTGKTDPHAALKARKNDFKFWNSLYEERRPLRPEELKYLTEKVNKAVGDFYAMPYLTKTAMYTDIERMMQLHMSQHGNVGDDFSTKSKGKYDDYEQVDFVHIVSEFFSYYPNHFDKIHSKFGRIGSFANSIAENKTKFLAKSPLSRAFVPISSFDAKSMVITSKYFAEIVEKLKVAVLSMDMKRSKTILAMLQSASASGPDKARKTITELVAEMPDKGSVLSLLHKFKILPEANSNASADAVTATALLHKLKGPSEDNTDTAGDVGAAAAAADNAEDAKQSSGVKYEKDADDVSADV